MGRSLRSLMCEESGFLAIISFDDKSGAIGVSNHNHIGPEEVVTARRECQTILCLFVTKLRKILIKI